MRLIAIVIVGAMLAGCAAAPPKPESRAEWNAIHIKTYPNQSPEQLFAAAEKVLHLADEDFNFEYPPEALMARRNYMVYFVIGLVQGQDYWRIDAHESAQGTELIVQISRQAGATTPSPVVTGGGQLGVGANTSAMPGREIYWSGPYKLFWSRLDYMLGLSDEWMTCEQAEIRYPDGFWSGDAGVLCGVTADDRPPDASNA